MTHWWQSIRDSVEQIKEYCTNRDSTLFVIIIIILVGIISFGLGRLSSFDKNQTPITLLQAPDKKIHPMYLGGEVVASRAGKRYHFPWCAGANTIKESNKIWFKTTDAARKAGYTPAGNCRGLK